MDLQHRPTPPHLAHVRVTRYPRYRNGVGYRAYCRCGWDCGGNHPESVYAETCADTHERKENGDPYFAAM